jgi:hypothetical protein
MPYIGAKPTDVFADRDLNGAEFILDVDADTSLTADTDDQIDIRISGADDFQFTANTFTALSGSTVAIASGATIANSGTMTGFGSRHNHLINGEFLVSQRATSFTSGSNNDDVYTLDRWNLVSEGNDIVDVTQSTTVPTGGALKSIALDVETANKQFGIVQIIEATNCTGLIGNEVTFSFKAKVSNASLGDVRAGIIAWSSTADAVTSDIIATYNDDDNPTLASNLTFENTPSDLGVTTSWVTYSVTGTIDTGSTTNVAVWIGSVDSATTAGHFLYITDCQLEVGGTATDFDRLSYGDTLSQCQRYYYTGGNGVNGGYSATTKAIFGFQFPQIMRAAPTAALLDTSIATFDTDRAGLTSSSGSITYSNIKKEGCIIEVDGFSSCTQHRPLIVYNQDPFISFTAEM